MSVGNLVNVGFIGKPHGYFGVAKIVFNENIEIKDESSINVIFIEDSPSPIPYFIEELSITHANNALIKLEDINSKEEAALLKGKAILLEEDKITIQEVTSGHYLVGYKVITDDSTLLGIIENVLILPSHLVATLTVNNKEVLIPLHDETVLNENTDAKELYVNLPEGLLDIYLS